MKISSIYSDKCSLKHLKLFHEYTIYNNSYDIIKLIIENLTLPKKSLSEGELGGAIRGLFNIKAGERDDMGWVPGTGYKEKKRRQSRKKKQSWYEKGEDNKWADLKPDDKEDDSEFEYRDYDRDLSEADKNVGSAIGGLLNIKAGERDDMGAMPGATGTASKGKPGAKQGKPGVKRSKQEAEQSAVGDMIKNGLAKLKLALAPKADENLELLFAFISASGEEGAKKQLEVDDLIGVAGTYEESLFKRNTDGNFVNIDWWNRLFNIFDIDDKHKIEILTRVSEEYKNSGVSQESLIYELDFINENHLSDELLKLLIEDGGFVSKMQDMFSRGKKNLHNFVQGQAEQIAYPSYANAKRDISTIKLTNARVAKMAVQIAADKLREKFDDTLGDADLEPDDIIADYRDYEETGNVSDDLKKAINLFEPVVDGEGVEETEETEEDGPTDWGAGDEEGVEEMEETEETEEDGPTDWGAGDEEGDEVTEESADRKRLIAAEDFNALFEEVLNDSVKNVVAKAEKLKNTNVDDMSFDEVAFLLKLHGQLDARQMNSGEARRILKIHKHNRLQAGESVSPTVDEIVHMMQSALWKRGKRGAKWIRRQGEGGDLPNRLQPPPYDKNKFGA